MKVIDKRKEKKDEGWKKGDVIYFESYDQNIYRFTDEYPKPLAQSKRKAGD